MIGSIGDAAERYGCDAAHIWELITTGQPIQSPAGGIVRLVADKDKRIWPDWQTADPRREPPMWQVEELPA